MKYAIFLLMALGLLTPAASRAQTAPPAFTDSDLAKIVAIQGAMLKVIGELPNNFEKYKGALLKKTDDGKSYYAVKDLDMGTPTQYIMVNADGVSVYIAVFSVKNSDIKPPFFASAAFTDLDKKNGFVITKSDAGQANGILKYALTFDTLHPALYLMDVVKIQGTLVVGN
jgi:hypothetical protein